MPISHAYDHQSVQSHHSEQLKVKAAFVLNLARFVEWPEESKGNEEKDIVICFYQYNLLQESVDTIRHKKINNKPITIKIVKDLNIHERCNVVLIPESTLSLFVKYNDYKNLQKKITITDLSSDNIENRDRKSQYSLENKIIFRLKRKKSRLRFEVNKIASKRLGIDIGSELLKLGILVKDEDRNE